MINEYILFNPVKKGWKYFAGYDKIIYAVDFGQKIQRNFCRIETDKYKLNKC